MEAQPPRRGLLARVAALACVLSALPAARAVAGGVGPSVEGPIAGPGSLSLDSTAFSLTPFGYAEEEFFLTGTAAAYTSDGTLAADGRWAASPGESAAYTTRIVVRRPVARARFNGTVVVEWLNVSGGFDAAPDWTGAHTLLLREGCAWVGVSAQYVGVSGGPPLNRDLHLKAVNPVRYAPLVHPGDSFAYDLFSQAGLALRERGELLLGGLRPRRLLAAGESQSAARLVTYIDAIHPLARVYDGFLVHSRGGDAAPLSQPPQPSVDAPAVARIRDDVGVPVFTFQTETDVVAIGFFAARQPDGPNLRTWEVAGAAHADTYLTIEGRTDLGPAALDTTHLPPVDSIFGSSVVCDFPINAGPQHYVLSAALRRLDEWVRSGRKPARAAPLSVLPGSPPTLERDALGNALGGVRTPQVDVPVAIVSGVGQPPGSPCSRFGTTLPYDASTLASLYPSHGRYVEAVQRATRRAVRRGFLLAADAPAIRRAAAASSVGR